MPADADFGPQPRSDNAFTARMRFHQSWYRATVLKVPCGTGPYHTSTTSYGNMLRREDAAQGKNFLTPEVHELATDRVSRGDGAVEEFRLRHNMLSSQPMCFNLFGYMAKRCDLATPLVRALGYEDVQHVTHVKIEHAPAPRDEYLDDATAFDAYVEYETSNGERSFIGIETKLTEPFSRKRYRIDDGRHCYGEWTKRADSPWPEASWGQLDAVRHNQLWRNHMLAVALKVGGGFAAGHSLLVRHERDDACAKSACAYAKLCKPGDTSFRDLTLEQIVDAWRPILTDRTDRDWLKAFHLRYCNLSASEADWQARERA